MSTVRERFETYVMTIPETACHWWAGSISGDGYGLFWLNGKTAKAHRVAWELYVGQIPPGTGYHGTCVCHSCDNRLCVNPDHLFLGAQMDNMRDMFSKNRANKARGERHGGAKIGPDDVIAIRAMEGNHSEIAKAFGISRSHVSGIKRRTKWEHVK